MSSQNKVKLNLTQYEKYKPNKTVIIITASLLGLGILGAIIGLIVFIVARSKREEIYRRAENGEIQVQGARDARDVSDLSLNVQQKTHGDRHKTRNQPTKEEIDRLNRMIEYQKQMQKTIPKSGCNCA